MSNVTQQIFKRIGLSDKEITVYLLGLRRGPMFASDIAKECGFTRPNSYDVLKRLMTLGFCSRLSETYGGKFKMSDPVEILHVLEQHKQDQEAIIGDYQKLLPSLSLTKGTHYLKYPLIEYFEGDGIRKILAASLQCQKKEISMVTAVVRFAEIFGLEVSRSYVKKRAEAGIISKTIRESGSDLDDEFVTSNKRYLREVRYASKQIHFDSTIILFDNRVGIITKEGATFLGTLITSTPIANTFRNWFSVLWNASKKRD